MSCVKLPSAVLLLVLSGLYLISLGCGSLLPGNLPLPAPPNGSAGAASVSISPQTAALDAGNSLQFTATSSGPPTADLEWLADGVPGGNSASGTISRSGLYTAPQQVTSNAVIVVAVSSKIDPTKASSATVTVLPGLAPIGAVAVLVSITPTSASVPTAGRQLFTASVTGTSNTAVTWGLSGADCSGSSCGTLSTRSLSAVYLAPSVAPVPTTVNVIATSVADPTKSASANLIIVPAVVVGVTPANVSTTAGTTQQFAASVTGTSNTAVDWTVSGAGCSGTACGTINSSGLYTAPFAVPSHGTVTATATSVADSTKSASADITIQPIAGATYYLATAAGGGNDSNNGTSASTPWLTPNHPVNCGDVILAAASTSYSYANFTVGSWGTVTCTGAPNVAWLKCITFDACKITASGGNPGIYVDSSYWGVQGWEVSMTSSSFAGCFYAVPSYKTHVPVHHIVFANNVANGCHAGGLGMGISSKASADYVAIVGNIAYNAAAGTYCYSNINVYEPINYDTLPGTHIYVAGNFSFGALNTPNCNGGYPATDGEGINIDTLDGSQSRVGPYTQQVVVDNNLVVDNGGRGIEVENNAACTTCAHVYIRHNTMWGDSTDNTQTGNPCAELQIGHSASNVEVYENISVSNVATSCNGQTVYAYQVSLSPTTTDHIHNDWGYSSFGNNSNISSSTGFSFDPNNTFGTNPSFANAVAPEAPSCGSYASVPACMATLIANFTPTNAAAQGYGYQIPSSTPVYDPLFPQWLCNVNLPSGLVTMGCLTGQQ